MLQESKALKRVIIAGAGPAGLSLASHLAESGVPVEVHAPDPRAPWPASFGVWTQSVESVDLGDSVTARFARPCAITQKGRLFQLEREYLRLDTPKLQAHLTHRAERAGVRFVERTHSESTLTTTSRSLAIDARGTGTGTRKAKFDCFQSAYGLWMDVPSSSSPDYPMTLMDFRGPNRTVPSFLYTMKESSVQGVDRLFVQETVLASKTPHSLEDLEKRLMTRLRLLGLDKSKVISVERCIIPMGQDLPSSQEAALPFGTAAAMVHPATGYQLSTCLKYAQPVARAIMDNLSRGTEAAQNAALETMWPRDRRKAWQLYRWSASVLTEMNQREMGDFAEAFFSLPTDSWIGFMQGTLTPAQILRVLARVFSKSTTRLKLRLLRASGGGGVSLGRILIAS